MAERDENCHIVNFPGSRATRLCNVSKQVLVAFPTNGGRSEAILNVELFLDSLSQKGELNCDKSRDSISDWFKNNVSSDLAKTMGWDGENIVSLVDCDEPSCFYPTNYVRNNEFKDDKGCKASEV